MVATIGLAVFVRSLAIVVRSAAPPHLSAVKTSIDESGGDEESEGPSSGWRLGPTPRLLF